MPNKNDKSIKANGVRTKNIFGKKIGNSNLIIMLFVCLALTAGVYYLVTSSIEKDTDRYISETNRLNRETTKLQNRVNEELIQTADFKSGLPESINPEEVIDEITRAARSAGISVLSPDFPTSYLADADMPSSIVDISSDVKAYYFSVSVTTTGVDQLLTFLENLYSTGGVSSRILYVDSMGIANFSTNSIGVNLSIYTFYRP